MTEVGLIAARFGHYAALVLAFGAFAYASYGTQSVGVRRKVSRLGLVSSVLLLLAAGAVLVATVAGLGGGFATLSDPTLWSAVIWETDFGRVWSVRLVMALALVAAGVAIWRRPGQASECFGLLLAGGLVATVALTGHAAAMEGASGFVHRAADAAHLVAAAVWLGALPPLLFLLGRDASGVSENFEFAARRLQAFHLIGLISVVVLVLSGLVNSWFLVGRPEHLLTTTYGRVLLAKLVLFVAMLGLAAGNKLKFVPAMTDNLARGYNPTKIASQLRLRIGAEVLLSTLVLLSAAILGAIEPAAA
ncbi:MAG TPA: copper homeostasis membrane protein CopD [Allosphingosinicella sp.]